MCKVLCWTKSFELKLDLSINSWSDEISRHFKMTMSIERYQANSVLLLRHKTIEFFFFLLHLSNNNKPHFGHNAFDGHVTKAFHFRMDFRLAKMCYSIQLELSFKLIKIVVKLLNFIWRLCSISFCLATYLPTSRLWYLQRSNKTEKTKNYQHFLLDSLPHAIVVLIQCWRLYPTAVCGAEQSVCNKLTDINIHLSWPYRLSRSKFFHLQMDCILNGQNPVPSSVLFI